MKNISELFGYILIGGVLGFIIRLVIYLIYKTPAIKFDGSAEYGFVLAILAGCVIFGIIGLLDIRRDNKKRL